MTTNWVLFGMNMVGVCFWVFYTLKKLRRETYAIVLNNDRTIHNIKKINPSEKTFDLKKHTYNIIGSENNIINYKKKDVILYMYGKSDSINILNKENSRIEADTLHSLLYNQEVKKLNSSNNPFFNIEPKFLLVGGAIVIGLIMGVSNGWFG